MLLTLSWDFSNYRIETWNLGLWRRQGAEALTPKKKHLGSWSGSVLTATEPSRQRVTMTRPEQASWIGSCSGASAWQSWISLMVSRSILASWFRYKNLVKFGILVGKRNHNFLFLHLSNHLNLAFFVFADEREDLTRADLDNFSSIIREVERLHELGILVSE